MGSKCPIQTRFWNTLIVFPERLNGRIMKKGMKLLLRFCRETQSFAQSVRREPWQGAFGATQVLVQILLSKTYGGMIDLRISIQR